MNTATLAQAKRDFTNGVYIGAAIYYQPVTLHTQPGYTVRFGAALAHPGNETALVDARTKQPRLFRSMDAAHRALTDIGFSATRFWVSAT